MKVAIEKEEKEQSWGVRFEECKDDDTKYIVAVDMETDEIICNLQIWESEGEIFCSNYAKECLVDEGYDPFEHGNSFDEDGAIIIKKRK